MQPGFGQRRGERSLRIDLSANGIDDCWGSRSGLQWSLVPQIKETLKPGGWVIFETYLIDQSKIGDPINPAYLLLHNELLDFFRDFRVLYYREGEFSTIGREHVPRSALGSEGALERVSILYVVTGA